MAKLFSAFEIEGISVKNRIVMPPMCLYKADNGGHAQEEHYLYYAARAMGGVGLIILEATGVEPAGRITDNCLGIWDDKHVGGLARIVERVKALGATAAIQLQHAGRKCEVSSVDTIYAPSGIAFNNKYRSLKEMDKGDINRVVEAFGKAAKRAEAAGFDMVEIHGAHGYLISTFLSPLTNHRQDEYGGSYENRARFACEVADAIKANFNGVVTIRVSANDFHEGGNTADDIAAMLNIIKLRGVAMVNVSAGGVHNEQKLETFAGYQTPYSETVKKLCNLPTITGGLLRNPHMMEEILRNNRADMVFLGRLLLQDPFFPIKAAEALGVKL